MYRGISSLACVITVPPRCSGTLCYLLTETRPHYRCLLPTCSGRGCSYARAVVHPALALVLRVAELRGRFVLRFPTAPVSDPATNTDLVLWLLEPQANHHYRVYDVVLWISDSFTQRHRTAA